MGNRPTVTDLEIAFTKDTGKTSKDNKDEFREWKDEFLIDKLIEVDKQRAIILKLETEVELLNRENKKLISKN